MTGIPHMPAGLLRARAAARRTLVLLALAGIILTVVQRPAATAAGPYDERLLQSAQVAAGDGFGSAVAIHGNAAVIGAPATDLPEKEVAGAAYIFTRSSAGGEWSPVKRLLAPDGAAFDQFGAAVALHNDLIAVAAVTAEVGGSTNQGAVYLFARDQGGAGQWGFLKKLTIPAGGNFDNFGDALAIQGDEVFVGAKDADAGGADRRGAVYVYRRDAAWANPAVLTDPDGRQSDSFGAAIAVDGDLLLIGSERADVTGLYENDGAALLFQRSGPGAPWTFFKRLVAGDADGSDRFGASVALHGGRALVGAPAVGRGGDFSVGKAYLYERDHGGASNWGEVDSLIDDGGKSFDNFGLSVALSATTAFVGANAADATPVDTGAVFAFAANGGTWEAAGRIAARDRVVGDQFAAVMALDGETLLVGGPGVAQAGGRAYAFTPGAPPQPSVTFLPLALKSGFTYTGDLTAGGVVISAEGVRLGAVQDALAGPLPVGIARTAVPSQPPGSPAAPLGDYYRLQAARDTGQTMDKAFILGLPIPDGADRSHLAIATLSPTAPLLHGGALDEWYWRLTPGVVDEENDLLLAIWPQLTAVGETVVLVEHPDLPSPPAGESVQVNAAAGGQSGNFLTACAAGATCKDDALQAFANALQRDYADFFANFSYLPPHLQRQGSNLAIDPPELGDPNGKYLAEIRDPSQDGCKDPGGGSQSYLGQYGPGPGSLHICLAANAGVDDRMLEVIRHELFHAFQHGFPEVLADSRAGNREAWIIEGSATAVQKSGQNWERGKELYFPLRAVDKGLRLEEPDETWPYQVQDFWVFFGRTQISMGIDWLKFVFVRGARFEDVQDATKFSEAYWAWVRNQAIDHNETLDDFLGPKCTLEEAVVKSMVVFEPDTTTPNQRFTGTTTELNSTVVELKFKDDWHGLPASIAVRMLPDGTPQPEWFDWKVYRLPYPNCSSFPSNVKQDYDQISPNLRYFVVLGNSDVEGPQEWEITLE